jgi:hypothetical protein
MKFKTKKLATENTEVTEMVFGSSTLRAFRIGDHGFLCELCVLCGKNVFLE